MNTGPKPIEMVGKKCSLPPDKALYLFKRDDGKPWVGYADFFYPEFNVAYLKWKLTGIAKEGL